MHFEFFAFNSSQVFVCLCKIIASCIALLHSRCRHRRRRLRVDLDCSSLGAARGVGSCGTSSFRPASCLDHVP